jgi:hypothetical protein
MLYTSAMQQGGSQYRRLVGAFSVSLVRRSSSTPIRNASGPPVVQRSRFNFMSEARIWFSRDPDQKLLPGDCQSVIVLSDEFYREILNHPGSGGGQGAMAQSCGAGSFHVAFVSLLHCSGTGTRSTLRQFRSYQPTWERRLCAASKVPGEVGGLAGSGSYDVACMSGLD